MNYSTNVSYPTTVTWTDTKHPSTIYQETPHFKVYGLCPICNASLEDTYWVKCNYCNRELIRRYYLTDITTKAKDPFKFGLRHPIRWLDSFVDLEIGTNDPHFKLTTLDLNVFNVIESNLVTFNLTHFKVAAYMILIAWDNRDTSKRYLISNECIYKLKNLNFKELEQAYLIFTL